MTTLLEVRNATKTFHSGPIWQRESTVAVDGVSFSLTASLETVSQLLE